MKRPFPQGNVSRNGYRTVMIWLLLGWLLLAACQPKTTPPVTATSLLVAATSLPTATPAAFTYGVTVLDSDGRPIADAQIIIEIEGKAPLENEADEKGYANLLVPASHAERPGRLRIRATGFESFDQNIDIYQERLPNEVRLIAQVIGNTTGFCPDNLTYATGFEPAKEGETLVVVSNFADTLGNDPRNLTFDLFERMTETLKSHEKIRIERLNCAIKQQGGSETAKRIGSRQDVDASIVIWGVYVEPPDPEVHLYFDIVKQKETYLGTGFDRSFGPQAIQPSMFDFKASLGEQAGEVVAFATGLVFFNASEHLAAEPLFTTAIAAADQPLVAEFSRALRFYRSINYWHLGRFLEVKRDLEHLKPQKELTVAILNDLDLNNREMYDLDLSILNLLGLVHAALGERQQALYYLNQALLLGSAIGDQPGIVGTLDNLGSVYADLGEMQQALYYLNQALLLNRVVGDKAGEAVTLNNIGRIQSVLGNKQQALTYYTHSLLLNRAVGDKAGEAVALNNIGSIHSALGNKQQALDYFNPALLLNRAVGDKAGEAAILNNLGSVYSALGDKQQALDYYNQALLLLQSVGAKDDEAAILNNIGGIYSALGDEQQALDYYNRALLLLQGVGAKAVESATRNNIGRVYADLGDKQQALDYYNQALLLLQAIGNKVGEATTLANIGGIYADLGDNQQALDCYNRALLLLQSVSAKDVEAATRYNIGRVYAALVDKQQALDYYSQALPLLQAVGNKVGEANTLTNIGDIYADLGDKQQALDYYNQALLLYRAVGDKAGEATSLNNTGFVYADLGDEQQALDYYNQALLLYRAVDDKAGEATSLNNVGALYLDLSENTMALGSFQQALQINLQLKDKTREGTNTSNIGRAYAALGEPEKALTHFRDAIEILQQADAGSYEVWVRKRLIEFLYAQDRLEEAVKELEIAIPLATELKHPDLPALQSLSAEINTKLGK